MPYSKVLVTDAGNALRASAIAHEQVVKFTNVVTSSHEYGYTTDEEWKALTDLLDKQQTTEVSRVAVNPAVPNQLDISYSFTNAELTTSYYARVIGLYANNPDGGDDILFALMHADENPQYVPAFDNIPFSFIKRMSIVFSDNQNVTIEVNFAGYVTFQDLEDYFNALDFTAFSDVLFVSLGSESNIEDGTILNPYKTINAAKAAAAQNTNLTAIFVGPGQYNETVDFTNLAATTGKQGLVLRAAAPGTFIDSVNIPSMSLGQPENFIIDSFYIDTLSITSTVPTTRARISNCRVNQLTSVNGSQGTFNFENTTFQNTVQFYGENLTLKFENCICIDGVFVYQLGTGVNMEARQCYNFLLNHAGGRFIASQDTRFGSASGIGLISTASGPENPVILLDASFLQEDRTYAKIQLGTNTSYYITGKVVREPMQDVMNPANRLGGGTHTDDIYDHQDFQNIQPQSEILSDILSSFDESVGVTNAGLGDISTRIGLPTDAANQNGNTLFSLIRWLSTANQDEISLLNQILSLSNTINTNTAINNTASTSGTLSQKTTTIINNTATNNSASATGTLSQKLSQIISLISSGGIAGTVKSIQRGSVASNANGATVTFSTSVNASKCMVILNNGQISHYGWYSRTTGTSDFSGSGTGVGARVLSITSTGMSLNANSLAWDGNVNRETVYGQIGWQVIEYY